ncbi:cell wall metabolism sensor histidine kinase WalK [Massilia sp. TS11]|uniref:sensor histidine kinase n=1 Tax=Massilia sp. TS11 TaxID=2908003 RepID=UPI001EDA8576|nr:HAMP domain-containing sensor histidine kinase [Massilia sp. TS11]MCG2584601.1 HAMP domain-containing histidine kinase [Massilia sp. TS11]
MGRLFWKFFLSILLAQVAATLAIGGAFWLRDLARQTPAGTTLERGPSAEFLAQSAAATLRHGGPAALAELLAAQHLRTVYAVDQSGRDALGRSVPVTLLAAARQSLQEGGARKPVEEVALSDGRRYLIFVEHERRTGPGEHAFHELAEKPHPDRAGSAPPPPGLMPREGHHGPGGPPPDRQWWPVLTIGAATLASLLFAALLAWYFARPIRALRSAFDAAAAGDLSPRFATALPGPSDELNDLGRDFDRMSQQLHNLVEGQRRLLHDVSHELRSPLARMQAAIGLAHQTPEKTQACLERIEKESARMDKLVGQLLQLARLNSAAAQPRMEPVNLRDMLDSLVADIAFEAEQKGQQIGLDAQTDCTVRAAPDLLWSALENILRNAVKHGPQGAPIEVRLHQGVGTAEICVADRGPGVPEAELPRIFDAFYRTESAADNVDGHGLGLAIAQRVLTAHQGSIRASNRTGGGLEVCITLPLAPQH